MLIWPLLFGWLVGWFCCRFCCCRLLLLWSVFLAFGLTVFFSLLFLLIVALLQLLVLFLVSLFPLDFEYVLLLLMCYYACVWKEEEGIGSRPDGEWLYYINFFFNENDISNGGSCYIFIVEIFVLSWSQSGFCPSSKHKCEMTKERSLHVDSVTTEICFHCK